MAIDGSFSLGSELERFLARCPQLRCIPRLKSLSQKGNKLKEEEVVNSIAELFLHPNYTIPMMGCFRPIVRKIVDKAVELLRLVPSLKSNSNDAMAETSEDQLIRSMENTNIEDSVNVIEFYVRSGRGLKLHELSSLAFCRALDLAPFLLESVLSYFKYAPPPFERLLLTDKTLQAIEKDATCMLDAVRASLRLLLIEPKVFCGLWDWSCFLDLVQQCAHVGSGTDPEFLKNILDIRWCSIQILSIILHLSDRATESFGLEAEKAITCLFRWEEFCQDVSVEKAGFYLEATELEARNFDDVNLEFNQGYCLQSMGLQCSAISYLHSNQIDQLRRNKGLLIWDAKSVGSPYMLTLTLKKSFEMVLLAVSQKWPVLLYGPAGSGKTALIRKLAQVSGNRVLFIHMDEQMDGKTLIGSYVCTEQPGEFRWQPGSLTQAVLNGLWVVFEDIDNAPSDVHSILLPLLEGASSFVTGRGEEISVAESFRLFGTISSSKHDGSHNAEGNISFGVLLIRVMIGLSNREDLFDIVNAWYPNLETISEKLIETFEKVNSSPSYQPGGCIGVPASSGVLSRFSLRDLLKWCKRITGHGFNFMGLSLSAYECKSIYQEAVDIFASSSISSDSRLLIMREIAKMWGVLMSEAETLYPLNKPIIQDLQSDLQVGRVTLKCTEAALHLHHQKKPFVDIRSSLHVLERIACSVKCNESVLLVGETGTGKTTLVQNLAARLGQSLTVLNLSQQSDIADLLGGFKPTDPRFICIPVYNDFEELFSRTFSVKDNGDFLVRLRKHVSDRNWKMVLNGCQKGLGFFRKQVCEVGRSRSGTKRKRPLSEELIQAWEHFSVKLETARRQIGSSAMVFSFVEGSFVTAIRNGHWILLDEINLAPPEMLQRITGVLEGDDSSICLAERGDVDYIRRHPDFRIFACMNPATDAGKRDLPYSLRSRFTEYFVDDVLDDEDLTLFVKQFMDYSSPNRELVNKIVCFYKAAKKESEERLQDGANQKPQFSLRSLYRALEYTKKAERNFGFQKALYDGFCMFFLTLLDSPSSKFMNSMILSYLLGGNMPPNVPFDGYFLDKGKLSDDAFLENYVLTKSVKEHLRNLARAILIKKYPVLLQGPTSSGKTSLVQYLAAITGHEFVRINNHEHTDLQEYLGSYLTDAHGKLVFQEGVLVKAVRNGYWIVLDELNLAPSDVLEALNRLLDDNRELFVPELQETVIAHPDFMLFATQNPPTFYGGRKMLSRAFRNRFVEIHVDEIPEGELSTILDRRCKIPESYAKKMVEIMKDLQLHRQSSKVFAGKHGFITPRDLFRWADRFRTFGNSYEDLAKDGYFLLAERLRDENEKKVVQEILERHLRVKLATDNLYQREPADSLAVLNFSECSEVSESLGNIMWTRSMWRLYFLVERCFKLREPVLLVGETGGGKTTVCQLLSIVLKLKLHILNCHQYTETSDFLGGFYPVRDRSRLTGEFKYLVEKLILSKAFLHFPGDSIISTDIVQASSTLDHLTRIIDSYRQGVVSHPDVTMQDLDNLEQVKLDLVELSQKWQTIFMWQDGPLVRAMKDGDLLLVDEISLADDSVLERLNSVLEPERKLSLAEKGGSIMEKITAHPKFFLLATMNPGGDYGKKELSPALRNRFTEIWVPSVCEPNELRSIAEHRFLKPELLYIVDPMLNFWEWFNQLQTGRILTVRDFLSWVAFINATEESLGSDYALIHGAFLVLLDGLNLGTTIPKKYAEELRRKCLCFLLEQLKIGNAGLDYSKLSKMENYGWGDHGSASEDILFNSNVSLDHLFGIDPFYISKGNGDCKPNGFEFLAPTTRRNAMRVLRAMQLPKPVLLEGSPGVGKTSLVVALGKFSGHKVVRINLSEQTDMMDLLGSDLPTESEEGIKFAWSDGILLQALKDGSWVLLDELNLAPQSVLEGLNAILDHRAEVFIPELGCTFKCPPTFRVFACQNPSSQGGGRKGLPKSFLNRFTKVYVDELAEDDYLFICSSLHPSIPKSLLSKLILFNKRLYEDTMLSGKYGQDGSPWEFNLRDVIRSCHIIEGAPDASKLDCFLSVVYIQRMRTEADRKEVIQLYEEVFGVRPSINPCPRVQINPNYLVVGNTVVERNHFQPYKSLKHELKLLPGICNSLEAALHCVQNQWLCILVGPSSSGKTSIVRLLAQLTGNVLNELNLSSATDISELLGCFEQYNAFRSFRCVIAQIEQYIGEYCNVYLESSKEAFIIERKDLISKWLDLSSRINGYLSSSSTSGYADISNGSFIFLDSLVHIIEQMKLDLEKYQLPVSWTHKDLSKTMKIILNLQECCNKQRFSAKFEWVTGVLIKAIECGEWIVLDNANLCNPTVLDRINSLVEPGGSITVNECGLVDGRPLVLQPHSKFRMFLTVNPRYGEISRAMRNRGVEIFMMQPNWLLERHGDYDSKGSDLQDIKRFLVLSGIPISEMVDSMAEAHIYARDAGLCLGVHITLLELSRWVQLFQQLLLIGNRPMWSLHLSWEHTYLSSLGEAEGRDIVMHGKLSCLSATRLSKFHTLSGRSLSFPGGWPSPLCLKNFILSSREACVRQNCMYLESLGAQCAAYELYIDSNQNASGSIGTSLFDKKQLFPSLIPLQILNHILFPTTSDQLIRNVSTEKFDLALTNKMLLFAANWMIEQAFETDLKLYILWLSWYSSKVNPYCHFFKSFLGLLEKEIKHPIWNYIIGCRRELFSQYQVGLDARLFPILSLKLVELTASKMLNGHLYNGIQCWGLLQLSLQQWKDESEYDYREETHCFIPVLEALRELEKEVLNVIVLSPSFDLLFQIYTSLIDDHMLFWKGISYCRIEYLLISWHALEKDATKLKSFFPKAVRTLMESKNLVKVSSWSFHLPKSMLWVHGGHPLLPTSAKIYAKQQQLLRFCELVWPLKKTLCKQPCPGNDCFVGVVASDRELRSLTMQGVCMSSYFTRCDQDDTHIVEQLEEMYQMLLTRFEYEKHKLESVLASNQHVLAVGNSSTCCAFYPEMMCEKSAFDSWQEILPIIDNSSLALDMELLPELSKTILFDANEQYLHLSNMSELLKFTLNFSLNFSSRPPTDFVPHQKILWTLEASSSSDMVKANIASFVLEMWFKWHSFLWSSCPESVKIDDCEIRQPYLLFQPIITTVLEQILQSKFPIKDYSLHCLKLRVTSRNLWECSSQVKDIPNILFSSANSLFQQIIFAHRKSFEEDKFLEIKSILCSIEGRTIEKSTLQTISRIIATSSHGRLTSLRETYIEPLLQVLSMQYSSNGFLYNLGCAWVFIGGLRFHLLLNSNDLDPAMKYSIKHSHLMEKISMVELEIKVRQECDHLAGRFSIRDNLKEKAILLEKLEAEKRRLQKKVIFRPEPGKFIKLKSECDDFLGMVKSSSALIKNLDGMCTQQLIDQSCNWQETATRFIARLSEEYATYIDIIQPIQVSIYEMKLGISLVVSSALQKVFLNKVEEDNFDRILESIYSFMRFPRVCAVKTYSFSTKSKLINPCSEFDFDEDHQRIDMNLLKLCTPKGDTCPDRTVSFFESHTSLYHNILVRIMHSVVHSLLLDNSSFMILNEIFDQFASMWMNKKVQEKVKENDEALQFKFRPRAFKIEDILEVDISSIRNSSNESLCSEWQEILSEELNESVPAGEYENLEEEWNLVQESFLINMVHLHTQLFGSIDLVANPGIIQVSDADRLSSFLDAYKLGTMMLKELRTLLSSGLDAKLMPEHLLRLCLEHEKKFGPSHKVANVYNIYKDSNAPVMAKMVNPLTLLKKRILSLLNEWTDHPGLQKILDVTEMLLGISLTTPLAKALSGLQFLLSRTWVLQENTSKFSLSDELEPIVMLVSSWQRMEIDSWPALLDEILEQYEINAGKLWFPLYLVLHHGHTTYTSEESQSTIQSLEEFMQISSVGEFKKRLKLLCAFHGQINTGICLGSYSSPRLMENLKILYNVFGFYIQFLPIISEHIEANRRNIETELKELVKLCRWEHSESYLSMESFKRTRQKLRKLIKKFNDVLQEPVMVIINQKATQRGIRTVPILGEKLMNDYPGKHIDISPTTIDMSWFTDNNRSIWFADWAGSVDVTLNRLLSGGTSKFDLPHLCLKDDKEVAVTVRKFLASQSACLLYQERWKMVWSALENICKTATECGDLWRDEKRNLVKRRALSDLLKLLECCGLQRHKPVNFEDQCKPNLPGIWLLQPSYEMQHLLLIEGKLSSGDLDITASTQFLPNESVLSNWKVANQYYYKSMASVQLLRQVCLNFHKDFSLEQVNRSASFLNHLVLVQQEQRSVAYGFSRHLERLRKCMLSLKDLDSKSAVADHETGCDLVTPNQHAINKCMWQQKLLFDNLCSMAHEAHLLLRTVESTHSNTCPSVKATANKVLLFIEKFIPDFQKSKELLDHYLLSNNGYVTTQADSLPLLISKRMEQLVIENFQVINDFEGKVRAFCMQPANRSLEGVLLSHFQDVFNKAKVIMKEFYSILDLRNHTVIASEDGTASTETFAELDSAFSESFKETLRTIMEAFGKIGLPSNGYTLPEESEGNVTLWKVLFESYAANLRLDLICDEIVKTLNHAKKLVDHSGHQNTNLCSQIVTYLHHLRVFLEIVLNLGDGLLLELLAMHRTVAEITHMLADLFASLYSQGFGTSAEEQVDDTGDGISQDAKGTGMGEGVGLNDVSDQINDEDQLLGTKSSEGQDASNEDPSRNNKGIEMDQDFAADTFSVSEDSGDDGNEDSEDENLESAMGDAGNDRKVVDEKLWNKDEDGSPNDTNENYESGPSVRDKDSSCRELRAKEDSASMNESGEINADESEKQNNEESHNDPDDNFNTDDMKMDKDAAFTDPTGLQIDDKNENFEDMNTEIPECENSDAMEEAGLEDYNETGEDEKCEDGERNSMDEDTMEAETEVVGNAESNDPAEVDSDNADVNLAGHGEDAPEFGRSDLIQNDVPSSESTAQPNGDAHAADSSNAADMQWSRHSEIQNGNTLSRGLPSSGFPEMETSVPESSNSGNLAADQPKAQLPQNDSSSVQKNNPNPYRSVGDALEGWKERVKVSVDSQVHNIEDSNHMDDDNANEYGFVQEFEKGTDQALGAATSDQIDKNINDMKPDGDKYHAEWKEDVTQMEIEKQDSIMHPIKSYGSSMTRHKMDEGMENSGLTNDFLGEEIPEVDNHNDDPGRLSGSLVSINRSYFSEHVLQLRSLSVSDKEMGRAKNLEEVTDDIKNNASALWRRYELLTTRLSQELAEQLRLVMQPTLASKLQGDYKTGKRINMKKVIPYIASHYRKDKIWLRRTRPNKRDYQVVVAVDDSRSMSESRCGDVAIEALVTVCRAMSQLEVGKMAVTSFGKKGNIRVLHDFDQPFTGEAGVKMISSLTFKQENTIADEPMVDLLKYLNNMLDAAVANARLPSGQNPLQQLILIIADGRFHEKESLKRCVRDVLSRKRMVAFLLLDSPEESIMDLMEASFKGEKITFSKYLDSFPFPYYIILKNIEALPRTLADLLRQWFELMQNTRD
ncbi:PREDICTED: midasin isoform X2 [Nelumbo nucifera]|uniref:Midasin n=1 Tax=Nelumbo nucifera TaxID=4432 RepID=A0A1U8A676_NELNU|nr:PREDICTED: midasin isoform X2 [Nelumbo nucifera]